MTPLDELLARPAFAVGARVATWADVLAAARASGGWEATEAAAAAGLSAVSAGDLDAAAAAQATRWRRARRLISADDTVAFLARWGIGEEEWLAHMRRRAAAERCADARPGRIDASELARPAWIEGVTTGALERAARQLAGAMAVWASAGGAGEPAFEVLALAAREHAAAVASPARIAALIESRWFEWTRLTTREVLVTDEGAARELEYCLRIDGRDVDDIAAAAGVPVVLREVAVGDLSPALAGRLGGARAGDVVGPLAEERGFRIAVLVAREAPSAADPAAVERAREELVARSIRTMVAQRVRWLDAALAHA